MISQPPSDRVSEHPGRSEDEFLKETTRVAGILVILVCLAGSLGNISGIILISSVCAGCKTLAFSAALIWIFFGAVLVHLSVRPLKPLSCIAVRTVLVLLLCLQIMEIISLLAGKQFIVESLSVMAGSVIFGPRSTPISPIASILIIIAACGLFFCADPAFLSPHRRDSQQFAAFCGILVALVGYTFTMSYLFGTPLLFPSSGVPIAALSAFSAFVIGLGLIAAAGPAVFPVNHFTGNSIRSRLMRTFVSLTVVITISESVILLFLSSWLSISNEILVSASLVVFILATAIIVGQRSEDLGRVLETAEKELADKNVRLDNINMNLLGAEEQLRQNVSDLTRTERELRESREQLMTDLISVDLLQKIGMVYLHEGNLRPVLSEVVTAAIAITRADFGNIQLVDPSTSRLKIMAYQGFPDWWVEYWNTSSTSTGSCGTARKKGERVIVEDIKKSEIFAGTPALDVQLRAGIRAVQSTPIVSREGKLLGMCSTHFKEPHRPDERQLAMLDILARLTADILERAQYETVLQRGVKDTDLLAYSARLLLSSDAPEWVVQDICEKAMHHLGCSVFLNYLMEDGNARMRLNAWEGIPPAHLEEIRTLGMGTAVCGRAGRDGVPVIESDIQHRSDERTDIIRSFGVSAYACLPLIYHGSTIGTLSFGASNRPRFTREEIEVMLAVTRLVAMAIARKKIEDTLRGTSQYLENLITYANAPIIVWDNDLRILRFNHAFEFLTGMTAQAVIGRSLEILFPDQYCETALAQIRKTSSGERWESVEIPIRQASGAIKVVLWNSANIYDTDGITIISTIAQGHDITERKIAEEKLQKTASLLSAALESTADGILVIDNEKRISGYNTRFCSMWGIEKRSLEGTKESALLASMLPLVSDRAAFSSRMDELYAHKCREGYDIITLLDGRIFERYSKPQMIGDNAVGRVWSYRDITERKLAEHSLEESLEKFRIIATSTPDHIMLQDKNLRYTEVVNPQIGLTVEEMIGKSDYDILPKGEADRLTAIKKQVLEGGAPVHLELPIANKMGERQYFSGSYIPRKNAAGEIDGIIGYFQNITEKKVAEEKILAALMEKEVLIREIHHRVKNNLQIITGLLDMTRYRTDDAATSAILTDIKLKIRTMAQIHTRLYESNLAGRVNMGDQIRDMTAGFFTLYGKAGAEVRCDVKAGDFTLAVDQAVPCALAINEILSNSFKHAFTGRRDGTIRVSARQEGGNVHICIEDNGIGIPAAVDPRTTSSLGLKLIRSLAEQLHGSVSIQSSATGTRVIMDFPFGEAG